MRRAFFWLLAGGAVVAAACSYADVQTVPAESGKKTRDAGVSSETEDEEDAGEVPPDDLLDADVGSDFDAGIMPIIDIPDANLDAPDGNPCVGRGDGFKFTGAGATERCCKQMVTDMSKPENCGACGIACAGGKGCIRLPSPPAEPNQFSCGCDTNPECAKAGYYGANATCYAQLGVKVCNCQCTTGTGTMCGGRCGGGGACKMQTQHNACTYP